MVDSLGLLTIFFTVQLISSGQGWRASSALMILIPVPAAAEQ